MKNILVLIATVVLVVVLGYVIVKYVTCPIPKFNDTEIEFIQNEEGLK